MAGERHREGNQRAAAEALDYPGRDQPVDAALRARESGHPRTQAPSREQEERDHVQAAGAPQVRGPAGEWHRNEVGQQVGVDDPRRASEIAPAAEVGDDGRQRDRDDHELRAADQDPE